MDEELLFQLTQIVPTEEEMERWAELEEIVDIYQSTDKYMFGNG